MKSKLVPRGSELLVSDRPPSLEISQSWVQEPEMRPLL
jgi:hypothetical protein